MRSVFQRGNFTKKKTRLFLLFINNSKNLQMYGTFNKVQRRVNYKCHYKTLHVLPSRGLLSSTTDWV